MENTVAAVKTGRGFNASHKDAGVIVHAVPPLSPNACGDWFTPALCGTEPGIRGNGWSKTNYQVSCPKCLKKMEKNIRLEKTPANDGLPTGWYKEPGFPIWYTTIFKVKFRITNGHAAAPGMWYCEGVATDWVLMDDLLRFPEPEALTIEKHSNIIFKAALKHARKNLLLAISKIDYKIEQLENDYYNEREQ